jgi:hypothetical protein
MRGQSHWNLSHSHCLKSKVIIRNTEMDPWRGNVLRGRKWEGTRNMKYEPLSQYISKSLTTKVHPLPSWREQWGGNGSPDYWLAKASRAEQKNYLKAPQVGFDCTPSWNVSMNDSHFLVARAIAKLTSNLLFQRFYHFWIQISIAWWVGSPTSDESCN